MMPARTSTRSSFAVMKPASAFGVLATRRLGALALAARDLDEREEMLTAVLRRMAQAVSVGWRHGCGGVTDWRGFALGTPAYHRDLMDLREFDKKSTCRVDPAVRRSTHG